MPDPANTSLQLDEMKSAMNAIDRHSDPQKDGSRSNDTNHPIHDNDEDPFSTPRPRPSSTISTSPSKSIFSQGLARGGSSVSLPSPAQSPTRRSQSTTSTHTRSKSPMKQTDDLIKLDKPVRWEELSTDELLATMRQYHSEALLQSIYKVLRKGYLPRELRGILDKELNLDDSDDACYAERSPRPVPESQLRQATFLVGTAFGSLFPPIQQDETSKVNELLPNFIHLQSLLSELEALRAIVATTRDHLNITRTEASWNELVHRPMLDLTVTNHPGIGVENVTRANIASVFLPPTSVGDLSLPSDSRLIDYAMVLRPVPPPRRVRAKTSVKNAHDGNKLSNDRIVKFVDMLEHQTFNQSRYKPLCKMPSGVFIETKAVLKSAEAQTQLGLWLASWYGRVSQFPCGKGNDNVLPPPVIPVLIVEAALWELYFAFDMGSHYDVCGPVTIGGTRELSEAYRLLAVLRILAHWMETDFSKWVENCLQQAGV
ncbi:hypothetical protein O1611_g5219 [Lasiodiplodia mahajangana]|uniref:Uncharacterized protein n=1 Tax=Lasiodiplodia mahajangana TaxID=1108764 RepID=A0ACC2JM25_9PEZI|nr:hypothetical protein O1611_g5219 [Lasiodiplodia mahajangana]